jgi:transcriptional regulator EpsA
MTMATNVSEEPFHLSGRELERLAHVINASLAVRYRHQFFLWVQGQLQSFVPHEVLICAFGDPGRRRFTVQHFSSYPLPGQDVERLDDAEHGLVGEAVRSWAERGERPLLVCNSDRSAILYRRFESTLATFAFPNLAVHGVPVLSGSPSAFFLFANLPQPLGDRLSSMMEMLIPHVHSTYLRVLSSERAEATDTAVVEAIITTREVEILQWVREGKSNLEIGTILQISPLTVKNHVQKILKKLGAQNRAQAVAKAMVMQILRSAG